MHFLTYPQCDIPLEQMLEQLKRKAGDKYGWCVISAEDHEERENDSAVGVHRHVIQEYNCKTFETTNARYWDLEYEGATYHPHFEPVKNKVKCLQYVIKDGQYICDGTHKEAPFSIDVYLQSTKTKGGYGFTYAANEIQKGKDIYTLMDEIPGFVMNHKRKIEEFQDLVNLKKQRQEKKPQFYGFEKVGVPAWEQVVQWVNKNFLEPRAPRQKQLWLWSDEPGLGKSFPFLEILPKYYNCYQWMSGQKQDKDLADCQYIIIDEFHGSVTMNDMKSLSQMYRIKVDIKYGQPINFTKNVPLIVTSNHPPREVYRKCSINEVLTLEDRFEIIKVDTRCYLTPQQEPLDSDAPTPLLPNNENVLGDEESIFSSENEEDSETTKLLKQKRKN
uniref:Putative rep protein n=1 Tax=uncultured virus TaxID=340016 RepID=A0A1D8MK53_9VIRU|nr:putative rep protein [uncultured virus]